MIVVGMLPAVAVFGLLWCLRRAGALRISVTSALLVGAVFLLVLIDGLAAGVSEATLLVVALFGFVVSALLVSAYLALWRLRGGTVNGRAMPW